MKTHSFIYTILLACGSLLSGADYLEVRNMEQGKLLFQEHKVSHQQAHPLPHPDSLPMFENESELHKDGQTQDKDRKDSGYHLWFRISAVLEDNQIKGKMDGTRLLRFIDFGEDLKHKRLSPVTQYFQKEFVLEKPGSEWLKIEIDKDRFYELRWIQESEKEPQP